jgi:hypothetical protein
MKIPDPIFLLPVACIAQTPEPKITFDAIPLFGGIREPFALDIWPHMA